MANNSIKRDQNRQKELAYIRKVKQTMQPKSTEERQKEIAAEQADHVRTAGSKVSDFLYYYKWRIVLIVLFSLIAVILVVNLLSMPSYDTQLLAIYSADVLDTEKYREAISEYGYDLDGNGAVELELVDICLSENQAGNMAIAQRSSMAANLQRKEINLYLVDDSVYQELMGVSEESFVDLSSLYPDHPNIDGRRFLIQDSQLEKDLGLDQQPGRLGFIIRTRDHAGNAEDSYNTSMKILQNMIEGTKTKQS